MKHLVTNPFSIAYSYQLDAERTVEVKHGQAELEDLPAATVQAMRDSGMTVEVVGETTKAPEPPVPSAGGERDNGGDPGASA